MQFEGEIILFFLPPRKDKETPPTKQHICKPHKPTRKPKFAKELFSCPPTRAVNKLLVNIEAFVLISFYK
jgi:hypothetical protein